MKNRKIAEIEETGNNDFPYNVRVFTVLYGELYYAGIGRFCRTIEEAKHWQEVLTA